jgi:voltage-gated potassium channel
MARYALHPQVSGVVDVTPEYRLEEIEVSEGAEGVGQTIESVRGGAVIMGVKRADGTFLVQPSPDLRLEAGDVVMAMGTVRTVSRLETLFCAPARS